MLDRAENEMSRPGEDVVTHLVCQSSRHSLYNYLVGYLLSNGIEPESPVTLAKLLFQCRALDDRFKELDITSVRCRFEVHDDDYCLELESVGHCYDVARKAQKIVGR